MHLSLPITIKLSAWDVITSAAVAVFAVKSHNVPLASQLQTATGLMHFCFYDGFDTKRSSIEAQ